MENVTRDVITDLWQLYVSGEASADTRTLVETFYVKTQHPRKKSGKMPGVPLSVHDVLPLTPDHELRTLVQIKRRLGGPRWLLLLAMVFTAQAIGRIVSDTSFDVSPRKFSARAVIAALSWVVFLVMLFHGRREVLGRIRR